MSLTVINRIIAEARIQMISLNSILGGHEFVLNIHASVHAADDNARYLTVNSARVSARSKSGASKEIGQLFPNIPFVIRQFANPTQTNAQLRSLLLPQQLTALEAHRDGGDLDFDVTLWTTGGDTKTGPNFTLEQQQLHFHFSQSEWVKLLNTTKAFNVLLLEIPGSSTESGITGPRTDQHLRRAQKHLLEGNYRECVSECRQAVEQLPHLSNISALDKLNQARKQMGKDERDDAILDVIRHYTHLAAHSEARGGVIHYSRSDAIFVFRLTAALVAHRSSEPNGGGSELS